ncbi:hypothetical protein A6U98_00415 [Rhizobium sp. WYCCWR10014]|uniref:hypothetical protein n=1 Tax=Rhizobium sp. WYCCWR10014 TaxID=1825933 RepID=UPI0007E420A6|nr:hypothetical protein [Rhizobium sp. WYCCWR10014]OAV52112.1 hypothetical protein A6U98_00415 [Rhizobium sp. WYCCWR10014]
MVSRAFFQKPDLLYRPATLLVALDRVMMEDRLQLDSPGNEGIRCIAFERHICPVFLGLAGAQRLGECRFKSSNIYLRSRQEILSRRHTSEFRFGEMLRDRSGSAKPINSVMHYVAPKTTAKFHNVYAASFGLLGT